MSVIKLIENHFKEKLNSIGIKNVSTYTETIGIFEFDTLPSAYVQIKGEKINYDKNLNLLIRNINCQILIGLNPDSNKDDFVLIDNLYKNWETYFLIDNDTIQVYISDLRINYSNREEREEIISQIDFICSINYI
jgi:hypothetical protein